MIFKKERRIDPSRTLNFQNKHSAVQTKLKFKYIGLYDLLQKKM